MNLDSFDNAGRRESGGRKRGGGGGGRENIVLSDAVLQMPSKSSDPTSLSVSLPRGGLEEQWGVACPHLNTHSTESPQQSEPQYDAGKQNIASLPQFGPQYDAGKKNIASPPQSGPQYDAGSGDTVSPPQSGLQYNAGRGDIVSPPQSGPQYYADRQEIVIPFEVDLQDSQDLISLNEELEEMLNPKVGGISQYRISLHMFTLIVSHMNNHMHRALLCDRKEKERQKEKNSNK